MACRFVEVVLLHTVITGLPLYRSVRPDHYTLFSWHSSSRAAFRS